MNFYKLVDSISQYISEAVGRIFSPTDDAYPTTGVQPFSGEPSRGKRNSDW